MACVSRNQFPLIAAVIAATLSTTASVGWADTEVRYGVGMIPVRADNPSLEVDAIVPHDVNDDGTVVGTARCCVSYWDGIAWREVDRYRGFYWKPGMSELQIVEPTRPDGSSDLRGLNNAGVATGNRTEGGLTDRAIVVDTHTGELTNLPMPTGYATATGKAINEFGQVVGTANSDTFLWDDTGRPSAIMTENATPLHFGTPTDINNPGVIVGYAYPAGVNFWSDRPFKYMIPNAATYELPVISEANGGRAEHINDEGLIGGSCSIPRSMYPQEYIGKPCYWDSAGTVHDLRGKIPGWGDEWLDLYQGEVTGVTADGTLVGYYHSISSGFVYWVYDPDTDDGAHMLEDLIVPADASMHSFRALHLSDHGVMTGWATKPGLQHERKNVIFLPYTVSLTNVPDGVTEPVALHGGLDVIGGGEIAFDDVVGPVSLATHYGQGPASVFATAFLPDPDNLNDIVEHLLVMRKQNGAG